MLVEDYICGMLEMLEKQVRSFISHTIHGIDVVKANEIHWLLYVLTVKGCGLI